MQLQQIYEAYTANLEKARQKASPLAGIFGTRGGLDEHPCHETFYESVGCWVDAFLAAQPQEPEIAQAAHWILTAAAAQKKQPTFPYCFAAQNHAKALIPLLSQAQCEALRLEYEGLYPDCSHLPLHGQITALLCAHSGSAPRKKGFFCFLHK